MLPSPSAIYIFDGSLHGSNGPFYCTNALINSQPLI